MNATEIDLTPFCDPNPFNYAIDKPFFKGGWHAATDGRIMVRLPAPGTPDSEGRLPRTDDVFNPRPELAPPVELIRPPLTPCEPCDGSGERECECCGHCRQCGACTGTGLGIGEVLGIRVHLRYVHRILKLPNPTVAADPSGDRLWFWFDGGEGCLMGISDEKD